MGAIAVLVSSQARAVCDEPPLELLWTYPVDGQREVPTNAAFWFVSQGGGGTVRLDGTPLNAGAVRGQYVWGDLMPNRDYTLTYETREGTTTVRFRSGPFPSAAPAALEIAGHREGGTGAGANFDACFDTGPSTRVELQPDGDTAIPGFVINGYAWGATQGEPAIHLGSDSVEGACIDIAAIGIGGLIGPTTQYCVPVMNANDGCNVGGATHGWLVGLAIFLRARRRHLQT